MAAIPFLHLDRQLHTSTCCHPRSSSPWLPRSPPWLPLPSPSTYGSVTRAQQQAPPSIISASTKTAFHGVSLVDRRWAAGHRRGGGRRRLLQVNARTTAKNIEVEVDKPLGLALGQKPGGGVVITFWRSRRLQYRARTPEFLHSRSPRSSRFTMVHFVHSRPDRMEGWPFKLWEMQ